MSHELIIHFETLKDTDKSNKLSKYLTYLVAMCTIIHQRIANEYKKYLPLTRLQLQVLYIKMTLRSLICMDQF